MVAAAVVVVGVTAVGAVDVIVSVGMLFVSSAFTSGSTAAVVTSFFSVPVVSGFGSSTSVGGSGSV